jgi:replicative DNA helicase
MQPRTLPSNLDAEAAILGGVYLRRGCLDLAAVAALEVEDFYSPKHQATFTAIRNLEATAKPIDPVTVDAELQRLGKSESVGGLAFQAALALHVPSENNVEEYARIVAGLAVRRRLIATCADVVDRLYHPDGDDLDGEAGKSYAISASRPSRSRPRRRAGRSPRSCSGACGRYIASPPIARPAGRR